MFGVDEHSGREAGEVEFFKGGGRQGADWWRVLCYSVSQSDAKRSLVTFVMFSVVLF